MIIAPPDGSSYNASRSKEKPMARPVRQRHNLPITRIKLVYLHITMYIQ